MRLFGNLLRIFGWFITSCIFLATIVDIAEGDPEKIKEIPAAIMGGIVIGVLPLLLGYYLVRKVKKQENNVKQNKVTSQQVNQEIKFIQLVRQKKGLISVADVVLALQITSKEAQAYIDSLTVEGTLEIQMTKNGLIMYRHTQYISDKERKTAEAL